MTTVIKPPRLRPGDRVGVLAPASPCPVDELESGCLILEKMGLEVVVDVGSESLQADYLAGSDEYRASRFNQFVQDPEIRGLFCARGGTAPCVFFQNSHTTAYDLLPNHW